MANVLDPKLSEPNEAALEGAMRPRSFSNFIGQKRVVDNLSVFISAAQARGTCLDHALLYGAPGLGKTSLAQIIAREMGAQFRSTSGPLVSKAADLAAIVTQLQPGDVLFIDEIHRLPTTVEEVLYSAMEDFKLDVIVGEGPTARTLNIDVAKFTLVGATTRSGMLSKPFKDRFGIQLRLSSYTVDELAQIIAQAATATKVQIDDSAVQEVAKRARGTPRVALRLFRRVVDFAHAKQTNRVSFEIAHYGLSQLEVDDQGLDSNDLRYLTFLNQFNGNPVGVETISAGLSEDVDCIEDVIEPYLIQRGFIQKTPRGRMLTEFAVNHLRSRDL